MTLEEMSKDKYNIFVPVAQGYHLELMDTTDKRHRIIGFMVHNPAGMPDWKCAILPVVVWGGDQEKYAIFRDDEEPF